MRVVGTTTTDATAAGGARTAFEGAGSQGGKIGEGKFATDFFGGYTEHPLVFSFMNARKQCGWYNRFPSTELHLHGVTGTQRTLQVCFLSFHALGVNRTDNVDFGPTQTCRSLIDIVKRSLTPKLSRTSKQYAIKYFYRLNLRRELPSPKQCLLYVPLRNVQYQKVPSVQIKRHAMSKPSNIDAHQPHAKVLVSSSLIIQHFSVSLSLLQCLS